MSQSGPHSRSCSEVRPRIWIWQPLTTRGYFRPSGALYRLERGQTPHQLAPIVQRPGRSPVMLSEHFAGQALQLSLGRLEHPFVSSGGIRLAFVDLQHLLRQPPVRHWFFPARVLPGILLREPQSVFRSKGRREHRSTACERPFEG